MKADATALKNVLTAVATHTDEMQVRTSEDGWRIVAMSQDKTSVIDTHIPASAFEDYEVIDAFRMDVKDMLDPVKNAKDKVEMAIGDGVARFKCDGLSYRRRLVAQIDPEPKVPNLPGPEAEAMVSADEVKRLVAAVGADVKDKAVRMTVEDGTLLMEAVDGEGEVGEELTLDGDRCAMVAGRGRAAYSMQKWAEFLKAAPAGAMLTLGFKDDFPLKAEYRMDGRFDVTYVLAPRIEQE